MSSSTWKRSPAAATSLPRPLPISSTSTSSAPTPTNKTSAPGRSSSSSNLAGLSNSACFHLSSWIITWTTPGDTMSLGTPMGYGPLPIQQILLPQTHKALQLLLPVLGNPSRILSRRDCLEHRLIHQQIRHPLHLEVIRIQLMHRGRQFNSQFRRIESIPIQNNQVDAFTAFPRKVTR